MACNSRKRGNDFNPKEDRFRLDIRKKFFMIRMVRHWTVLPQDVLNTPPLQVFRVMLDWALSNLMQ